MIPVLLQSQSARLALAAGVAAASLTCSGDDVTRPSTPEGEFAAAAGPPARIIIKKQPPGRALDQEVWEPGAQPVVVIKDAAGANVAGATVAVSIANGSGALQGTSTMTTGNFGTATFADLGIAGTGSHTLRFTAGAVAVNSFAITIDPLPPEAATGKWSAPVSWGIVPLHISLLPTGKVLAWGKYEPDGSMGMPRLWNPASGTPNNAVMMMADTMLFCAGHTLMADGRLMVSGGHKDDDRGLDVTNIFDPTTETWVPGLPRMAAGRWYPTVTTLGDGRLVTVAGRDANSDVVLIPELWENGRWVRLPGASLRLPYYPRQFLAPNGRLFMAGERIKSRYLNVDATTANGRGAWSSSSGFAHVWPFNRDYGSAVMYETGKILMMGGGGDLRWSTSDPKASAPTATAETIDLNVSLPRWVSTDPMHFSRRHLNATILPDGQVLVTGGTRSGGFNDLSGAVRAAEVWDPRTGKWTRLAANGIDRSYHSVSLLLPDATVLHGASGDASVPLNPNQLYPRQANHEIFQPPYLFKGARPAITGVSSTAVGYGQQFTVNTPHAKQITSVRWIRLGSATHAFDAGQRANSLSFSRGSGLIRVTAPANGRRAPPGHYLVFILNRNGVPSPGRVVRVG